jgi:hypothetical protein
VRYLDLGWPACTGTFATRLLGRMTSWGMAEVFFLGALVVTAKSANRVPDRSGLVGSFDPGHSRIAEM